MSNPNPTSYGGGQGPGQPFDPYQGTVPANQPGSNPNNYPPNNPYNPYGAPPPPTPGGTPPPAGAPFDPYAVPPTVAASPPSNPMNPPVNPYPPSNPGNPPSGPYQYPNSAPGANPYPYPNTAYPPNPAVNPNSYPGSIAPPYQGGPPPAKPRSSGSKVVLIILAIVVVLGGVLVAFATISHNNQVATEHTNATATTTARNTTATAQTHATATAQVNATATAVTSTYPFSANLKLNDPMTDNSKGISWKQNDFCSFTGGAYHAVEADNPAYVSCYASNTNYSNFTYQVDMKLVKGDWAGITFRGDNANSKRYAMIFSPAGDCILFLYTQDKNPKTLYEGTVSANVTQGATVGVVARGSQISLYVNSQQITSVSDSTYSSGQIGTIAYYVKNPADAQFTNAKVWQL